MPSPKQYDLITIGDSTIDTFIRIHDASVECDINHEECRISVRYGDKIPVDSISRSVAGNAANVAVGAAKLGLKTATYTNVGDDAEGEHIKKTIEESGVSNDYIKVNPKMASNSSAIITFQGERTAFVYHQAWSYSLPDLADSKWVYFSSLSESFVNSNIVDEVAHYIDQSGAKLAFGPGTYQIKANVKRYPKTLERCALLICNLEEAKKILEIDIAESIDVHVLLSKLLLLGPKWIIITDGEEGAYFSDGQQALKVGIFPVQIVEKTGAGDAFSAAFLAATIYGEPVEEALVWATINSSQVISHTGPQRGLMDKASLVRYRKTVSEMVAAKF